jgi:endonuclease/exonuclease/phosphatase family metal-dependent hydrolase
VIREGAALAATLLALAAFAAAAGARPRSADTLTVVTLNLYHDQADWPRRLPLIVRGLRALEPDVVCLQEVLQHPGLPNQAATLGESLGCAVHFVSVDPDTAPKRYGNAILTPHRVLARDGRPLLPLDDYRVVAHVRLEVRGRVLDVYDTHLHHTAEGGAIRATQVRDLLAFVAATRGRAPVVLAGDFNAASESDEMRLLAPGFLDVYDALHPGAPDDPTTLNPAFGHAPRRIDHVLVARDARLAPAGAATVLNQAVDGVWPTDHFGVAVKLVPARR